MDRQIADAPSENSMLPRTFTDTMRSIVQREINRPNSSAPLAPMPHCGKRISRTASSRSPFGKAAIDLCVACARCTNSRKDASCGGRLLQRTPSESDEIKHSYHNSFSGPKHLQAPVCRLPAARWTAAPKRKARGKSQAFAIEPDDGS